MIEESLVAVHDTGAEFWQELRVGHDVQIRVKASVAAQPMAVTAQWVSFMYALLG